MPAPLDVALPEVPYSQEEGTTTSQTDINAVEGGGHLHLNGDLDQPIQRETSSIRTVRSHRTRTASRHSSWHSWRPARRSNDETRRDVQSDKHKSFFTSAARVTPERASGRDVADNRFIRDGEESKSTGSADTRKDARSGRSSNLDSAKESAARSARSRSPNRPRSPDSTGHPDPAEVAPPIIVASPLPIPDHPKLEHISIDLAPDITEDTESGWAAIAKSIREVDEQKIQDYKEDIDNILVFAGLYSAVLTGLLAESYQALLPDQNAIMISLLTQVVAQTHSYAMSSGFLNSTIAPLDITAVQQQQDHFEPPLAAKRVNVLWFASLTLSLISASFGILVKQWLREYLSGEYISPQARLRIRHFRTPGLGHWKVFAIAALLPLVLQLSLALFFVGLCFFTIDVHPSIGYTTIPLVAGWALLFLTAAFAPVLSPRCPYKIPLFKSVMQIPRAGLFRVIQLFNGLPKLPPKSEWVMPSHWSWLSLAYTEDDAAKYDANDVDILVDVDTTQTDDQLVMKMCGALKETHTDPAVVIDFVLKIIEFRLQTKIPRPLPLMLDLTALPVQICTILMNAVAEVLGREARRFPLSDAIQWTDLTRNCLVLLVARLPCLLSDKALRILALCFAGTQEQRPNETFKELFKDVPPGEGRMALCLHLQERLRDSFLHLNAWQFVVTTWTMMNQACCTCPSGLDSDCGTIDGLFCGKHANDIPVLLKEHTCDVLTGYMLHYAKFGTVWSEWHRETLLIIFSQWDSYLESSWYGALRELIRALMTDSKHAPNFLPILFHRTDYMQSAVNVFGAVYPTTTDKELILKNLFGAMTAYIREMQEMPTFMNEKFYLNLLKFIDGQYSSVNHIIQTKDRDVAEQLYLPAYRKIWNAVHVAFNHFEQNTESSDLELRANTCLARIDGLDAAWLPSSQVSADTDADFEQWAATFNPDQSFFDDNSVEHLMKFLVSPDESPYRRVRRLLWKRTPRSLPGDAMNQAQRDEAEHVDGGALEVYEEARPELIPLPPSRCSTYSASTHAFGKDGHDCDDLGEQIDGTLTLANGTRDSPPEFREQDIDILHVKPETDETLVSDSGQGQRESGNSDGAGDAALPEMAESA